MHSLIIYPDIIVFIKRDRTNEVIQLNCLYAFPVNGKKRKKSE